MATADAGFAGEVLLVKAWLESAKRADLFDAFLELGFDTLESISTMAWAALDGHKDVKPGHRATLERAVSELKDVLSAGGTCLPGYTLLYLPSSATRYAVVHQHSLYSRALVAPVPYPFT